MLTLTKSATTASSYSGDVNRFLNWIEARGVTTCKRITAHHIVAYLTENKKGGHSESTLHRCYTALQSYFKHLLMCKLIDVDPISVVPKPKVTLKPPNVPTQEQINHLLEFPNVESDLGLRDRAILELLYSSGLRASELCALQLEDYRGNCLIVTCGKGGKHRVVPITAAATHWIDKYLQARSSLPGYLFLTYMWHGMTRQYLSKMVREYATLAAIPNLTTHTLRHACATHLLEEGADLRLIQEVLGHASISSTQRYTHLSSIKMQEKFNQFHPRTL
jgi:integrase/recombinase XerD